MARHGSALRYAARVVGVRALNSWGRGHRVVQQESTATGLDAGGLGCTSRDGDLRLRTSVDGLPLDGMQEVRSSNLLSSTGQKRKSNESNSEYGSKVQQRRSAEPPCVRSDRASCPGCGCWQDTGCQTLNRCWSACHLRKSPCHRFRDSCHLVTTRPSWRAISASDCCRLCRRSAWAGRAVRCGDLCWLPRRAWCRAWWQPLCTKRLGRRRRDRAALGTSGAKARLFCTEAHAGAVRRRGLSARRRQGAAVAPVPRYYLE
jgi:hypothetical protein